MGLVWLSLRPPGAFAAGVVGTGSAASCTDAALNTALTGGGLVTFNCGGGLVTIDISPGAGGTGSKSIAVDTTIDGGSLITISGGNSVGVFSVNTGVDFTVRNLTIANGSAGGFGGGGIANNHGGTLTVTNSTFSGNSAIGWPGGGIYNGFGTVTVTNSTFSGNSADPYGGGISNVGTLTVTKSTFSGNSAAGYGGPGGGGIYNYVGTLTVTNSTFSGNSGGGIVNYDAPLTVTNSSFSDNSAVDGYGGGISNLGTLTVTNSTFSGNSAGYGGGIANVFGTLSVTNSTFSGNSATNGGGGAIDSADTCGDSYNAPCATLTNTIVANSTAGGNCAGSVADGGHNIEDGTMCGFSPATGSLSSTNPQLDPAGLKNNGGPTQTVALCTGTGAPSAGCTGASPAINAGDESVCSTTTGTAPVDNLDQRGYVRPGTGHTNCSIGAYEADSPGPSPCVGDCSNDGHVTVDEILTLVNIALGNVEISECEPGDANDDGQITVDEILTAVNNALNGCPLTPEQGCLASGGTVTSATCCASTGDLPDTCAIGACGCPPDASHEVRVCNCAADSCFDGTRCVRQ